MSCFDEFRSLSKYKIYMLDHDFSLNYAQILEKISLINPSKYAKTRNFLNGEVTRLSPYLTHGVISLRQIAEVILDKYGFGACEKFLSELAWREYYVRVWENKGDNIFENLLSDPLLSYWDKIQFKTGMPAVIDFAQTGIIALDEQITVLKNTGYMHNHARMWLAGTVTNIAHYHWQDAAKWLYYYLLDGDLASNTLSWQWVAGTSRNKNYFANQENINKYSGKNQFKTFLDKSYEELEIAQTPASFNESIELALKSNLELFGGIKISDLNISTNEVLLYHPWMLNPNWNFDSESTKILLIEPSAFEKNPISDLRIQFISNLASQIQNLQIVIGEINELPENKIYSTVSNPNIEHWQHINLEIAFEEPRYLFPEVSGDYRSFFAYWNTCLKKSTWLRNLRN